jgi:hypothetical protein
MQPRRIRLVLIGRFQNSILGHFRLVVLKYDTTKTADAREEDYILIVPGFYEKRKFYDSRLHLFQLTQPSINIFLLADSV